jgi:PHD/YefM family antitoxin component YafN of YafNO toxin-antitoxin module
LVEVATLVGDGELGEREQTGVTDSVAKRNDLYDTGIESYNGVMATMNISTARDNLPAAVELARTEAVFLERYGRKAAVLVSPERYELLMDALEDAEDIAAFDAAMAEEGPNIPWEQAKADLGWA